MIVGSSENSNQNPTEVTDAAKRPKLISKTENVIDLLAMPYHTEIEFNPPRLTGPRHNPVDSD